MRNETTFRMVLVTSVAVIGLVLSLGAYLELGWGLWVIPASLVVFPSIAYVAYDVRQFINGVHRAYKQTVQWRPDKDRVHTAAWSALACSTLVFTIFFFLFGVTGLIVAIQPTPSEQQISYIVGFLLVISVAGAIGIFAFPWILISEYFSKKIPPVEESRRFIMLINPISVIGFALYYGIWRGIPFVVMGIPSAISATKAFVVRAFYNVHSDGRKAVFADTAVCMLCGFLVGIPLGSMIAGALTGLVVGPVLGYFGHKWTSTAQTRNA